VGIEPEVTFTGGVARNIGMIEALNKGMNLKVNVSADSHFMGALGAALFALDHISASRVPVAVQEVV
jgi:activator of 2-hydroxyglutaryl-CoA dehydratase